MDKLIIRKADAFEQKAKLEIVDKTLLDLIKKFELWRPKLADHSSDLTVAVGMGEGSPKYENTDELIKALFADIVISVNDFALSFNDRIEMFSNINSVQLKIPFYGTLDKSEPAQISE